MNPLWPSDSSPELADESTMWAVMTAGAKDYVVKSDEKFETELLSAIEAIYGYIKKFMWRR